MAIHGPSRWFSFGGRARRIEFLLQSAVILAVDNVAYDVARAALRARDPAAWIPVVSYLLVTVLGLVANFAVIFRRLHDFGARGRGLVIALACILAVLGFVAWQTHWEAPPAAYGVVWLAGCVLLAAIPGHAGTNRFGPPPALRKTRAPAAEEIAKARQLVKGLARPTLRLLPGEASAVSRLGGAPALPFDVAWPVGSAGPLAFLAQIDLAEVRAAGGPDWLPPTGVLFFFNDDERYGFPDHVKVLFSPSAASGVAAPPTPLNSEHEFGERHLRFEATPSAPSLDWLDLDPRMMDAVEDLYPTFEPDHRLGGYPDEIQPICFPTDCELQARRFGLVSAPQEEPGETPWRLLLQVDADDELGMVWVDMGRLFVFVREEDARAGDFLKTIAFSQFY